MNNQNYNYQDDSVIQIEEGSVSKKFFANVFLWMFAALTLSTLAALFIQLSPEAQSYLYDKSTGQRTILGTVMAFAPLALVLLMGAAVSRLSYTTMLVIFLLFSVLLGVSLSFIFEVYTSYSVLGCFGAAAGIFGTMAILGYTTEVDLTKFGAILGVGAIGLFIAMIINIFMQSSAMDYVISFAGVAIFTGLTAFDVQKIKRIGMGIEESGDEIAAADSKKLAIMGALTLYLDFLNIFLFLLRIFGGRK